MNGEKYFLIVNLIAGQGRCKAAFPKVKAALERRHIAYDLHYTNEPMEAVDAAKMGIEAGFTRIIAMGGDGTVNEVANGLLGSNATLGVIPGGTGNDFVRMLGIPSGLNQPRFSSMAVFFGEKPVILTSVMDSDQPVFRFASN